MVDAEVSSAASPMRRRDVSSPRKSNGDAGIAELAASMPAYVFHWSLPRDDKRSSSVTELSPGGESPVMSGSVDHRCLTPDSAASMRKSSAAVGRSRSTSSATHHRRAGTSTSSPNTPMSGTAADRLVATDPKCVSSCGLKSPVISALRMSDSHSKGSDTQLARPDQDKEAVAAGSSPKTSKSRNEQFVRLFPDITDQVSHAYHCALVGDVLLQGILYITPNWFCFHSKLLGKKSIRIPVSAIREIVKVNMAMIIPNAIGISTSNDRFVFGSLIARRNTFRVLRKVWEEKIKEGPHNSDDMFDVANNNRRIGSNSISENTSSSKSEGSQEQADDGSSDDTASGGPDDDIITDICCSNSRQSPLLAAAAASTPDHSATDVIESAAVENGAPQRYVPRHRLSAPPGMYGSPTSSPPPQPTTNSTGGAVAAPADSTTTDVPNGSKAAISSNGRESKPRERRKRADDGSGGSKRLGTSNVAPAVPSPSVAPAGTGSASQNYDNQPSAFVGENRKMNSAPHRRRNSNFSSPQTAKFLILFTAIVIFLTFVAVYLAYKLIHLQARIDAYTALTEDGIGKLPVDISDSDVDVYRLRHEEHMSAVERLRSIIETHVRLLDQVNESLKGLCVNTTENAFNNSPADGTGASAGRPIKDGVENVTSSSSPT